MSPLAWLAGPVGGVLILVAALLVVVVTAMAVAAFERWRSVGAFRRRRPVDRGVGVRGAGGPRVRYSDAVGGG